MKTCPACAEEIQDGARVCRFCGFDFDKGRNPQLGKGDLAGCAAMGCGMWLLWPFAAVIILLFIGTLLSMLGVA